MDSEKIGKFICELRKEKNLSQYQLADMIPISRQAVSKWERGKTTPDTQTLLKLSEIFNVTINELLIGERLLENSIEELEETTLSILDQSNKKTKTIKRITTISISIILLLLLTFLSYYFINSYNTMEVYRVGNTNDKFTTIDGIFITTSEKYYLKLGKIKNKVDANINNIKLIYKKDNKNIIIIEDKDVDNLTIMDSYGYGEKLTRKDIKDLKNNLYIEITYNETEKETFKLRCIRDYKNSSLFFLKQHKESQKSVVVDESTEETKTEEKEEQQEETKQTINEQPQNNQQTPSKTEDTPKKEEPPKEVETTPDMIINKIKETCTNMSGTYMCDYDNSNILIMYDEVSNKITLYKNLNYIGDYQVSLSSYHCAVNDCESTFKEITKEYLFK